ncbi:MAG: hypothetical protein MI807_10980 [Verrucomicrobiales bacterium]|nr:hypothetical protein [Verrucomicrobiales bacterium]
MIVKIRLYSILPGSVAIFHIAIFALLCPSAFADEHALGLSDEAVSIDDFGKDLPQRQKTITERIDDSLFPENIDRENMLAERAPDDVTTDVPDRRSLFGKDRFLSSGPVDPGREGLTGATWRPSFFAFGNLRTAMQSFESAGGPRTNEWANRLDLFGNFQLTSTERFLIGFRPLDDESAFTGVARMQGDKTRFQNGFDGEPHTFFFEGYLDELFPRLDPDDRLGLDLGFSLGRQPLVLQNGILANDNVDAFALTKHNFFRMNASATRVSAWFAFNEIHRNDRLRDSGAVLYGLSSTWDYPKQTLEIDAAYVDGTNPENGGSGDGAFVGIGRIARHGYWSSTFRANGSFAMHSKSRTVNDGWLLTHQLSRTMKHSEDILTFSTYSEHGDYTSAARDPANGGPLGGFSFLQRAVGIGTYGAPLDANTGDALGFEISYQQFLDDEERRQLLYSAGVVRTETPTGEETVTGAIGLQYQQQLNQSMLFQIGGFGSLDDDGEKGFGVRTELQKKF